MTEYFFCEFYALTSKASGKKVIGTLEVNTCTNTNWGIRETDIQIDRQMDSHVTINIECSDMLSMNA